VIDTPKATVPASTGKEFDSITDEFCDAAYAWNKDPNDFKAKGGMKQMSSALSSGMTLVMSIWDDHDVNMLWLDSKYPTDAADDTPMV